MINTKTKQENCASRWQVKRGFRLAILALVCSTALFSCQQLSLREVQDYSRLLPQNQLLYLSLSVQTESQKAGFPYRELQAKFIQNEQLQQFIDKRLRRSQLALGPKGQFYAINQLQLDDKLFARQMAKQANWEPAEGSASFVRRDRAQAVQMPGNNVLYLSQGAGAAEDLGRYNAAWLAGANQTGGGMALPGKFRELQQEQPLVAYSPRLIDLIVSPMMQKAFPQALRSFAKVSKQFPVRQMLVWIEVKQAGDADFVLHLELATGSLLLSKGLEVGFRLFLPSLLFRSKQEFIRRQLPNIVLKSDEVALRFQMPLDQKSLQGILEQLKFQPVAGATQK